MFPFPTDIAVAVYIKMSMLFSHPVFISSVTGFNSCDSVIKTHESSIITEKAAEKHPLDFR